MPAGKNDFGVSRFTAAAAQRYPVFVLGVILVAVCVPAFFILPSIDDWNTSRPIFDFDIAMFSPRLFWRPFEELMRWAAGRNIALHRWIFHGIAVFGHVGGTLLLYRILCRVQVAAGPALAGAMFFTVSPAVAAGVWSVDSAIQTCSTCFGLASVWFLISKPGADGTVLGLGCAAVAALWKESGLAWFVAAPIFAAALTVHSSRPRRHLVRVGAGLCGAALYFAIREVLAAADGTGAEVGRYALQWHPLIWAKNAAMLLGVSCSTVDTVSLFGTGNLWAAAISFAGGLPLLLWAIGRGLGRFRTFGFWSGAVAVAALIAPHIVLGHVSEMYAYPVTAGIVLWFVGVLRVGEHAERFARWSLGIAFVVCFAVSAHKWTEMYRTGQRAKSVAVQILQHYGSPEAVPKQVCTLVTSENRVAGYSVFYASPPSASNWGRSIWAETKWRRPVDIVSIQHVEECSPDISDVWNIDAFGKLTVIGR